MCEVFGIKEEHVANDIVEKTVRGHDDDDQHVLGQRFSGVTDSVLLGSKTVSLRKSQKTFLSECCFSAFGIFVLGDRRELVIVWAHVGLLSLLE